MVQTKTVIIRRPAVQVEGNPKSFAHGLNFYKLSWIFFISSIIGCGIEMLWCYITQGFFESRQGLIYGPFSPVYGLGAVLFTLALYKIRNVNSFIIFAVSAAIGGAFEFLCSWLQQLAFGTVSWEYSNSPLNIHGRTNLAFSICWGLLGLVFIKHTLQFFTHIIEKLPNTFGRWLTWIFAAFMICNIIVSAAAVYRQGIRRENIAPRNAAEVFLDQHYTDAYLKKIYPNMIAVKSARTNS